MLPTLHEKALWGFGGVTGIFFQRAWVLWVLWVLVMESSVCGCLGAFWDILDGYINHHWIITDRFPERCQILNRRHQPMWILQDEVPPELTRMPLVPCPFRNRLEDFGGSFEAALDQSGLVASTLLLKLPLSDTKSQMTSDHWILIHPSQRHEVSWYT